MKKNGFTLSEVLVVLGIIGVVAALTLPSLMSDTAALQIGPKLAKAVSMFDQANAGVLNDAIADHLADSGLLGNKEDYVNKLTDHLKASERDVGIGVSPSGCSGLDGGNSPFAIVTAKDGMIYEMYYNGKQSSGQAAHKDKIGHVIVDINGDANPNEPGTDIFAFTWWGDGSIKPAGGSNSASGCSWTSSCLGEDAQGNKVSVSNYWACAGHIFENNLKVKYE